MPDKKLTKLLEQLHDELEKTRSVDEEGREMLVHLNADIRKYIDPSEEDDETDVAWMDYDLVERPTKANFRPRSAS